MAAITFENAQTWVLGRNPRTDDTTIINQCLADAIVELVNRYDFRRLQAIETVSAADGSRSSSLPTDFKSILGEDCLTYANKVVKLVHPQKFRKDHPYPAGDSEGEPYEATILGALVYWYPIPDASYSMDLWCNKFHAAWTTESHSLGAECDLAVKWLALALSYEAFQEYQDAKYWRDMAYAEMGRLISLDDVYGISYASGDSLYGSKPTNKQTDYGRAL